MRKAQMKISSLIISLIVIGLFVSILINFMAALNEDYAPEDAYNESQFSAYNKLDNITSQTEGVRDKVDDIDTESGVLDKIGAYFDSAYDAFVLTRDSADIATSIVEEGVEDANLGVNADIVRTSLVLIIIVIVLIGIVMSVLLKKDI